MNVNVALLCLVTLSTIVLLLIVRHRVGLISAVGLFGATNWVMAAGTIARLDLTRADDLSHGLLLLSTSIVFTTVAALTLLALPARSSAAPRTEKIHLSASPVAIGSLIVLSLAISFAYYSAIGYLAFFEGLENALEGSENDVASLRLQSYSGSEYFFPGYVNQFKNSLLPALVIVSVTYLWAKKHRGRLILSVTLVVLSLLMLLGTGQRGAFVLVALTVLIFSGIAFPRTFARIALRISVPVLAVFLLATVASGRASVGVRSQSGPLDLVAQLGGELFYRIFGSNQESSITGFRYVFTLEPVGGADWWSGIVGLLPGQSSQTIENVIFGLIYGSQRGTSPLSIWGSAFYNFGFAGAILLAVAMGLLTVIVSRAAHNLKMQGSLISMVGAAGTSAVIGTWVAGSPLFLLNSGIMVFLLLWAWGRSDHGARRDSASRSNGSRDVHIVGA